MFFFRALASNFSFCTRLDSFTSFHIASQFPSLCPLLLCCGWSNSGRSAWTAVRYFAKAARWWRPVNTQSWSVAALTNEPLFRSAPVGTRWRHFNISFKLTSSPCRWDLVSELVSERGSAHQETKTSVLQTWTKNSQRWSTLVKTVKSVI